MEQTGVVELTLMNGKFDATYPDSAVYVADYDLKIPHQVVSVATRARGTFRLTIVIGNNALWYIRSWQDQQSIEDSTASSWSELKAQFSN